MANETAHAGVVDATTGEYLAGAPSDEMKNAGSPVVAICIDGDNWTLVPEDEVNPNNGGQRLVVVASPSKRKVGD